MQNFQPPQSPQPGIPPVGAPDNPKAKKALVAAIAAVQAFIVAEQDPQDRGVAHRAIMILQQINDKQTPNGPGAGMPGDIGPSAPRMGPPGPTWAR